jgi:hypothetical protein
LFSAQFLYNDFGSDVKKYDGLLCGLLPLLAPYSEISIKNSHTITR